MIPCTDNPAPQVYVHQANTRNCTESSSARTIPAKKMVTDVTVHRKKNYLFGPKGDVVAKNLLVVAEQEGVDGVDNARGEAPPNDENHLLLLGHVHQRSGQVAHVRQCLEKAREKRASTLKVNESGEKRQKAGVGQGMSIRNSQINVKISLRLAHSSQMLTTRSFRSFFNTLCYYISYLCCCFEQQNLRHHFFRSWG